MIEEVPEKKETREEPEQQEIFSKAVRAGKRTYFFDVKATRKNDYFLTITESKKRFQKDGRFFFEKHKIFLYKEDFDKFSDGFSEVIKFIKSVKPEIADYASVKQEAEDAVEDYTSVDVDFDDLESVETEEKQVKK
ncbi:MAG: DUF3276 family protein [Bacteroidales bacterium]|nr:DUF3276 family protein [Bacteroidales bacterium]